jgi:hypothetical protein
MWSQLDDFAGSAKEGGLLGIGFMTTINVLELFDWRVFDVFLVVGVLGIINIDNWKRAGWL